MQLFGMALLVLGILGADQLSKLWIEGNLAMFEKMDVIPGLFHLTRVHNTGAAFSALAGMRWLFVVVFLLFTGALLWEYFKKPLPLTLLERWCLAAIYGGGLGNVIDRIRLGYVVDMIEVEFMNFAVFNVADCFITCGCILLLLHLAFFNKGFWKDGKKCA